MKKFSVEQVSTVIFLCEYFCSNRITLTDLAKYLDVDLKKFADKLSLNNLIDHTARLKMGVLSAHFTAQVLLWYLQRWELTGQGLPAGLNSLAEVVYRFTHRGTPPTPELAKVPAVTS